MRRFSEEERARIREELVETARELLVSYGPRKTTVTDITDPVGIAKPTFYQFFDAKSDLYIEIFERELNEYVKDIRSSLAGVEDPQQRLELFFRCYVEFGEGNEFVQQVFLRGDYRDILGDFSAEQVAELERKELDALVPPIEEIQRQCDGPIAGMEPILVLGLMGTSLGFLVLHRDELVEYTEDLEEFDDEMYEQLREALISTLARGLVLDT